MSTPEFSNIEPNSPSHFFVPDSLEDWADLERLEREIVFTDLQAELGRIEQIGITDKYHRSYHETYTENGPRRLLFRAFHNPDHGNVSQVMVNDETIAIDGQRTYAIRDFIVPQSGNDAIACTRSTKQISNSQVAHSADPETGPWLHKRSDYLQILKGANYRTQFPPVTHIQNIEYRLLVLGRRGEIAQELLQIICKLGEVSLESNIRLGD